MPVTTEDPENNFIPDYGKIAAYRSPSRFRRAPRTPLRPYAGAIITRSYDSLWSKSPPGRRRPRRPSRAMHRALWEFRIRGSSRTCASRQTHYSSALCAWPTTPRASSGNPRTLLLPRNATARRASSPTSVRRSSTRDRDQEPRPAGRAWRAACATVALTPGARGTKQKLDELGPEASRSGCSSRRAVLDHRYDHARCSSVVLATRMRTIDMTADCARTTQGLCPSSSRWNAGRRDLRCGRCAFCARIPGCA